MLYALRTCFRHVIEFRGHESRTVFLNRGPWLAANYRETIRHFSRLMKVSWSLLQWLQCRVRSNSDLFCNGCSEDWGLTEWPLLQWLQCRVRSHRVASSAMNAVHSEVWQIDLFCNGGREEWGFTEWPLLQWLQCSEVWQKYFVAFTKHHNFFVAWTGSHHSVPFYTY
jgi:hypothetical protein